MAFLSIITDNILPLTLFVFIGYFMDRRYHLDVPSLTKLTFYIVLPFFVFYNIYHAKLDMNLLNVFIFCTVEMAVLAMAGIAVSHLRHFSPSKTEAFKNGTMFSNVGNIGIALIALVYTNAPYGNDSNAPYLAEALAVATMALVQMNLFLNTIGLYQAGKGRLAPADTVRFIFHTPVMYTPIAAFLVRAIDFDMTWTPIWPLFQQCANAMVAIVMMALGMQIHRSRISFGDKNAWAGCALRLLGGPAAAAALLFLWNTFGAGFSNVTNQVILIVSCVPSAVNSVIYAVEFKNHEDFATELVMMSTFASCLTMPLIIYAARILFPLEQIINNS